MRRIVFPIIAILAICAGYLWWRNSQERTQFPDANVLLITLDTTRPDSLSCYGGSNPTPNIDSIAQRGILFENAFCHVPLTFPSHTSILTGLFPVHHGMHQNGLDVFSDSGSLVSTIFKQNGYQTAAIVSSFVLDRKFGLSSGFDVYDDRMERMPDISSNFEVERKANETVESALKLLDSFGEKKWFLWIHFYDPHTPYSPPPPFSGYSGELQFVDQQIGRLFQHLKSRNQDQDLILILLGDHGESLGEHGEATHGFFAYNSTLKIPLLLAYPGSEKTRVQAPASGVDVSSTLLELSGLPDPVQRDGVSLRSLLRQKDRKKSIYFETRYPELAGWNGIQGLIHSDWKLIATTRSELFNWRQDQSEKQNLFSQKEEISHSLKKDLQLFAEKSPKSSAGPDAETLEKLKSLGYVGSTYVPKRKGTADPKDKIGLWFDYERALQLKNSGEKNESIQILQSLVQREPENTFFLTSLAGSFREAGRNSEAVEILKKAVQNDPSDANSYHEMALAFKELRNFEEALKAEEAALTIQPERTEYLSVRAILLVETGRFVEAKTEILQVLKTDPNNPAAWNNLGNALRELGEPDEAIEAYKKAINLSPHYAYPLNGLATVLVKQDRIQEALPYFEKALQLDSNFFEVYLNMGIAYHSLQKKEKAAEMYRTFLKLAPDWMSQQRKDATLLLSQLQ